MAAPALLANQEFPRLTEVKEKKSFHRGAFLGDADLQDYALPTQGLPLTSVAREYRAGRTLYVYLNRLIEVDRTREELRWLSDHRNQYAGRWVALRGGVILAAGRTSRDVFNAVAVQRPVPRVVFVEPAEELPFAGW